MKMSNAVGRQFREYREERLRLDYLDGKIKDRRFEFVVVKEKK
jgi:hypothetical protein